MNVSVKMTAVEAIRRIDDDIFWSIDEFINTRPFRLTRTNFPLYYYNRRYVLLFTNIDKRYLDHIYTDADMLLATWDSRNFSPKGCKLLETSSRLPNCCACDVVVVLCGLLQETVMSRLEEHLVSTVITNWITLQVLLLPCRREDRFEELCQLIAEYDRLSFLLGVECEAKLRDNVIETVQMVTGTAAENTATIGIETTATTLGHAAAGVVLAVFVDVAVTASMLVRAKVRKDRGKITERQGTTVSDRMPVCRRDNGDDRGSNRCAYPCGRSCHWRICRKPGRLGGEFRRRQDSESRRKSKETKGDANA